MGVAIVAHSPIVPPEQITGRVVTLGGEKIARWRRSCCTYKPNPRMAKPNLNPPLDDLCVVAFSVAPNHVYLVTQGKMLHASVEMVEAIDAMHSHVQRLRVSTEEDVYRCADFIVRVGSLYLNARIAGTIIEVEYIVCKRAGSGVDAMREFMSQILADEEHDALIASAPDCESSLPRRFGKQHAALQFIALLRQMNAFSLSEPTSAAERRLAAAYVDRSLVREEHVMVGDTQLRLLVAGPVTSDRLVLLLHAADLSARSWQISGSIEALANIGVRAIAVDLPETNFSSRKGSNNGDTQTNFVERLIAALDWQHKLVIVAASAGGVLASHYILAPSTFHRVAGYFSVAATLDKRTYRPPMKARESDASPRRIPAIFVWGSMDNAFPPDSTAAHDQVEFFSRTSQKLVLNEAPHACYLHSPVVFNDVLVQFVGGGKSVREDCSSSPVVEVFPNWK